MALPRTMLAVLSFVIPLACSAVEIQSGTLHATADEFGYVTQYSLDGGVTNELWQLYGYIGNEYGVIPTAPGNSYSQFFDVDSFNTTATGITSSLRLNALGAAELGLSAGDILIDWAISVDGPPANRLLWSPTIRNAGASSMDLSFYAYLDLDINETENRDTAEGGGYGGAFGEGARRLIWTLAPSAQHYEAGPFPSVQSLLDNMTAASDLGDSGLPVSVPSDITAAWQFDLQLGAGDSARLGMALATPEPGTLGLTLLGIGVGWVALAGRRGQSRGQRLQDG